MWLTPRTGFTPPPVSADGGVTWPNFYFAFSLLGGGLGLITVSAFLLRTGQRLSSLAGFAFTANSLIFFGRVRLIILL